jgi:hypothetical protein
MKATFRHTPVSKTEDGQYQYTMGDGVTTQDVYVAALKRKGVEYSILSDGSIDIMDKVPDDVRDRLLHSSEIGYWAELPSMPGELFVQAMNEAGGLNETPVLPDMCPECHEVVARKEE